MVAALSPVAKAPPTGAANRWHELEMLLTGGKDGGLFMMIGRRGAQRAAGVDQSGESSDK